jgi:hypothetical protein
MSMSTRNRRFSYLGTLAATVVGLTALALPLTPAKAQIGVQVGPFGFGVGAPPPHYYGYPYYPPAYYPPAYGYYYPPRYYWGY